ncbi:multidrug efflux pump [Methylomagnum ishizawai]|uniref:Multidrug efflux pump n=1 Tax=Methylomagnum ishizawai TaxID=1760988 RepID=A0A1Y6D4I3_9GAMM|nr:efflux RND transporter permease subunit [Methylomagnum ishizawai]SMF97506.1 multidrug efflux pump [Methylomagnum ishizawai]
MRFTDLFIQRPVLAIVVNLLLFILGVRAVATLPIAQYPETESAVITVVTGYFGADPSLVAGFISTPMEAAITQANGIDYITSTSVSGISTITVNLQFGYKVDKALTEISAKVNSILGQLPPDSQHPIISVQPSQSFDALYIGFSSDILPSNNVTDYLVRVVQPKLQAVAGVQTAELIGAKYFALRAWLDPEKLAAYGLTATDIQLALAQNDYLAALGSTKGQMVQVNLAASTSLHSVDEFRELIVKHEGDHLVRLKEVATVSLGAEDYDSQAGFDGQKAVYIGIKVAPSANLLDVVQRVKAEFPAIKAQLPNGIDGDIVYDSTVFVTSSIREVVETLVEALFIVTLVVFLFLGSPRSVLITIIAIPLSLVATFGVMLMLGYSINLLTLLALVLAIGLVVDDAIIVVENVNRHLAEGLSPVAAARRAARELASPIVAMTAVLAAVYMPIGFQTGLTGTLFTEFAFTLVGAVTFSALVALTLSPMLCSRLLRSAEGDGGWEARLVGRIDRVLDGCQAGYARKLRGSLDYRPVTFVFAGIILVAIYFLYTNANSELAPQEDQGILFALGMASPTATQQQRQLYANQVLDVFKRYPETEHVLQMDMAGQTIEGMVLKPWDQRKRNSTQLMMEIQQEVGEIAGMFVAAFQPPSLPSSGSLPVQFVIGTTEPAEQLDAVAKEFMEAAQQSGMFLYLDNDLKFNHPQVWVDIDRDKAALLGLSMQDIGGSLTSMLGGGYVNYFSMAGRSYKVIPQVDRSFRLNADQLEGYYIRNAQGAAVPVSTVVRLRTETIPQSVNHFQQLNAATISGIAFPSLSQGEVLDYMRDLAGRLLPPGYSVDYAGQSRQFVQEAGNFITTFGFALLVIFLVLAAQFESFRDPLIILISVPMSIVGALVFVSLGLGGGSLNIYTEVGLVTLMGLISKHGILIVEFANGLQEQGLSKREAIETAAGIRLRPILMTTAAMVFGVLPLLFASGAGAASRFSIGMVIVLGLTVGTLFTLFVVPAVYMLLAKQHTGPAPEEEVSDLAASHTH